MDSRTETEFFEKKKTKRIEAFQLGPETVLKSSALGGRDVRDSNRFALDLKDLPGHHGLGGHFQHHAREKGALVSALD
jgi:hypothetical protein